MSILCFGSLNIDHVYQVDHIARPGETISSAGYDLFAGGKGANQSAALARAGADVFHAGMVGPDGSWLVDKLADDGVDMRFTETGKLPTGHAIIQVDRAGENAIVIHPGSNHGISTALVDTSLEPFGRQDILLLQNEICNTSYIISEASHRAMSICFNPAPFHPDVLDYPNEQVDLFILNETEAIGLAGASEGAAGTLTEARSVLKTLSRLFPQAEFIITLGAAGALYRGSGDDVHVPARAVKPVDTTGAGDTFAGYYLASKAAGMPPLTALERATTAAALCVTTAGAMDSIPHNSDVDAALRPTRQDGSA